MSATRRLRNKGVPAYWYLVFSGATRGPLLSTIYFDLYFFFFFFFFFLFPLLTCCPARPARHTTLLFLFLFFSRRVASVRSPLLFSSVFCLAVEKKKGRKKTFLEFSTVKKALPKKGLNPENPRPGRHHHHHHHRRTKYGGKTSWKTTND